MLQSGEINIFAVIVFFLNLNQGRRHIQNTE